MNAGNNSNSLCLLLATYILIGSVATNLFFPIPEFINGFLIGLGIVLFIASITKMYKILK